MPAHFFVAPPVSLARVNVAFGGGLEQINFNDWAASSLLHVYDLNIARRLWEVGERVTGVANRGTPRVSP